jgi:nitrogen fixation/metabolism regulation signal transduction histidine kinase
MFNVNKGQEDIAARSIFLVNRPFQLKYAILLSLLGGLVAVLFASHIFYFLNDNIQVFIPNFNENPEISQIIFAEQRKIAIYIAALILLVVSVLFFMGIMITHKIVGPAMVLKKKMQDIADGNYEARIVLRKGDEFKDLADTFNTMAETLQKKAGKK